MCLMGWVFNQSKPVCGLPKPPPSSVSVAHCDDALCVCMSESDFLLFATNEQSTQMGQISVAMVKIQQHGTFLGKV